MLGYKKNAKMAQQVEEIGLQILRTLSFSNDPLTLDELVAKLPQRTTRFLKSEWIRGLSAQATRTLYEEGCITSARRVNHVTLALNRPRFSITWIGEEFLNQYYKSRAAG